MANVNSEHRAVKIEWPMSNFQRPLIVWISSHQLTDTTIEYKTEGNSVGKFTLALPLESSNKWVALSTLTQTTARAIWSTYGPRLECLPFDFKPFKFLQVAEVCKDQLIHHTLNISFK